MPNIPGIENLSPAVRYVIAFVIIFVLASLFALVLRRVTRGRLSLSGERGRARQPRLGIVDVYDLDRQRQLILLRRDNVEHLLLVGGPNDVVVETNIVRVPGARLPSAATDLMEAPPERPAEIAPTRPIVEPPPARVPDRLEPAAHLGNEPPGQRGGVAVGGGVEPPLKPTAVTAAVGPRPPERLPRGILPEPTRAPAAPSRPAPEPEGGSVRDEAVLSSMTKQMEEALRRPAEPVRAPEPRPAEPRLPEPRPAPVRTLELPRANPPARTEPALRPEPPVRVEQPARTEPARPEASGPVETPPRVEAPPSLPAAPKPAPAPVPAARTPEPPAPPPPPAETPPAEARPIPVADAAKPEPAAPARRPEGDGPAKPVRPEPAAPEPRPAPAPQPPPAHPAAAAVPAAAVPVAPPAVVPPAAAPAPAKPEPAGRNDPFSIEDIEAEFARLLGRPIDKRTDRT